MGMIAIRAGDDRHYVVRVDDDAAEEPVSDHPTRGEAVEAALRECGRTGYPLGEIEDAHREPPATPGEPA